MFRTVVRADETTDVDSVVADLSRRAADAGVPPEKVALIVGSVGGLLRDLVQRGSQMAGIGSKVSASRTFADECYEVVLEFGAGQRRSLWSRLADAIRGR